MGIFEPASLFDAPKPKRRIEKPRDDQATDMDRLLATLESSSAVFEAPCGWGKTALMAFMIRCLLLDGKRVAVVFNRRVLFNQTTGTFEEVDPDIIRDISVMFAELTMERPGAKLHLISNATLATRAAKAEQKGREFAFPSVHFCFVDECHIRSKIIERWKAEHPSVRFCGFSATPYAQGLAHLYDGTLIKSTYGIRAMEEKGFLVRHITFKAETVDLKGVKTSAIDGDYAEGQVARRMVKINGKVVANYKKRARDESGAYLPAVCFPSGNKHGEALTLEFNQQGVPAAQITGQTPEGPNDGSEPGTRQYYFRRMREGSLKVLVSTGCISEGFDLPMVQVAILARPTKSRSLNMQQIGRVKRTSPGKTVALVFDHGGNYDRLGCITEPDYGVDALDSGEPGMGDAPREPREKKEAQSKHCKECDAVSPPGHVECIYCGAPFPIRANVEESDDELVQVNGPKVKEPKPTQADRQRWWSGLLWWANQQPRKAGGKPPSSRAYAIFCEKFGNEPKGLRSIPAECKEASGWAEHKKIQYRKSLEKIDRRDITFVKGVAYAR